MIITLVLIVIAVGAAAFFAESARELRSFTVTDYKIHSEKLRGFGKELKIVFLSDLHNKVYGNDNDVLLDAVRRQNPDLILITGDMLIGKAGMPYDAALEFVKKLPEIADVYYANGNHEQRMKEHPEIYGDVYRYYKNELVKYHVHFLENESVVLAFGSCKLKLNGLEVSEMHYKKFARASEAVDEIEGAIGKAEADMYEILLAHNPALSESYRKWGADLTLSGHLHGGIIRLPGLGGLITPQARIFPQHSGELSETEGSVLVVSRGLGTHTINIRFCNPAELVVLHLLPEEKAGGGRKR